MDTNINDYNQKCNFDWMKNEVTEFLTFEEFKAKAKSVGVTNLSDPSYFKLYDHFLRIYKSNLFRPIEIIEDSTTEEKRTFEQSCEKIIKMKESLRKLNNEITKIRDARKISSIEDDYSDRIFHRSLINLPEDELRKLLSEDEDEDN